jgi:hypothetical protein
VSFNYFISEAVFRYLVEAVDLVASHGWKLLPEYRFEPQSGLWRHRDGPVDPPLRLHQLSYDPATGRLVRPPVAAERAPESQLAVYLDQARARFAAAAAWQDEGPAPASLSAEFEHLRWFDLPAACLSELPRR